VEGALVPQYAPSRLPQLNGRWFEAQPPIELTWGEAEFPPVTWDTLQAAVFAGYRGSRGEVRVSYFHGYDDAPRITAELTTLNRTFVPLHVAGLDGEVLVGPVILRGEAGYFHFPAGADNGYALYQVEAEWSRASWRVIGGYGGSVGGDPATSDPASLDQAFLPSVFLAVLRGDATEWQIGLDATIGFRERDSWVHLTGSYPFLGHARVGASVDLISGDPGTFWGRWRDNDRLTVFLSLNF
jgi:hypothetical protein